MQENITNPTPEQIEKWKKEYGKVHVLEIPERYITSDGQSFDDEDMANDHAAELKDKTVKTEGVTAYLKTPSRKVISMATSLGGKDPIKFGEIILKNCWLGGDERIKDEDELFLAANGVLGDLIRIKSASLKNC